MFYEENVDTLASKLKACLAETIQLEPGAVA